MTTLVSRYQNVSVLDFIGAKDDGGDGDNCSYKTCKEPVNSSPPTNQVVQIIEKEINSDMNTVTNSPF